MSSDSDSEADVPLGKLVIKSSPKPASKPSAVAQKKRKEEKRKDDVDAKKAKFAAKPKNTNSQPQKASNLKNDADLYYETMKGQLLQKLICRWWYAITWPQEEDLQKPVPAGFEQLDGYPGVYICVKVQLIES